MYFGMAFFPSSRHPTKNPTSFLAQLLEEIDQASLLIAGVFLLILRDIWVSRKQWSAAKIITEIPLPFQVYQNISSCPSIPIKSDHKFYVPSSKFSPTLILFVYSIVHALSEFWIFRMLGPVFQVLTQVIHITPTQHCIDWMLCATIGAYPIFLILFAAKIDTKRNSRTECGWTRSRLLQSRGSLRMYYATTWDTILPTFMECKSTLSAHCEFETGKVNRKA